MCVFVIEREIDTSSEHDCDEFESFTFSNRWDIASTVISYGCLCECKRTALCLKIISKWTQQQFVPTLYNLRWYIRSLFSRSHITASLRVCSFTCVRVYTRGYASFFLILLTHMHVNLLTDQRTFSERTKKKIVYVSFSRCSTNRNDNYDDSSAAQRNFLSIYGERHEQSTLNAATFVAQKWNVPKGIADETDVTARTDTRVITTLLYTKPKTKTNENSLDSTRIVYWNYCSVRSMRRSRAMRCRCK